jgi:hypothetical protein
MIDQIADHPQVEYWREAQELAVDIVEHEVPRLGNLCKSQLQ